MSNETYRTKRPTRSERLWRAFLVVVVGILGTVAASWGQYPGGSTYGNNPSSVSLTVTPVRNMTFPCLQRTEDHTIRYTDWAAGQFEMTGAAGCSVRVRLRVDNPTVNNTPDADPDRLATNISSRDVAISRDGGVTWIPINDADLDFVTRFPTNGFAGASSILVRIGLRVSADADQQRGNYCGRIRLTATYVN